MVNNISDILASFQSKIDETLVTIQENKSLSAKQYILEQAARDTLARIKNQSNKNN